MKYLAVIAALLVAPGLAMAEDSTAPSGPERLRLWNGCQPIWLAVEYLPEDAFEIGLTKERIETVIRSRLRAARIYAPERNMGSPFIYANVFVVSSAFSINLLLYKMVHDLRSNEQAYAATWRIGVTGIHARDGADFILQFVSDHADKFIDEYLRVNADACNS